MGRQNNPKEVEMDNDAFSDTCLDEFWSDYIEGVYIQKVKDNDRDLQEI